MAEVLVEKVTEDVLQDKIQLAKDSGKRILALSPSKIRLGVVKEYILVTQ